MNKENLKKYVDFSDEVKKAMEEGRPVVALESTIISHGMPYPMNLETAKAVEEIIRKEGATPATTAIINGRIKVGLSKEELEAIFKIRKSQMDATGSIVELIDLMKRTDSNERFVELINRTL